MTFAGPTILTRPLLSHFADGVMKTRSRVSFEIFRTVFDSTLGTWIFSALGIVSPPDNKFLSMIAAVVRTVLI